MGIKDIELVFKALKAVKESIKETKKDIKLLENFIKKG